MWYSSPPEYVPKSVRTEERRFQHENIKYIVVRLVTCKAGVCLATESRVRIAINNVRGWTAGTSTFKMCSITAIGSISIHRGPHGQRTLGPILTRVGVRGGTQVTCKFMTK